MKKIATIILFTMVVTTAFAQKFNWNKNRVIAHRGGWKAKGFPENSIASLNHAVELGCYGSEFDVWLTSDNVLVVNHDPTFLGADIESSTYAQLLEKTMSNGEKIPTLEAYIKEGMKQRSTKLILEVKPSKISKERTLELTDKCFQMVKELKAKEWVEYISFSYEACKRLVELDSKAKVFYLNGNVAPEQLKADKLAGADYNSSVYKKNPTWNDEMHKLGLITNVWTVNNLDDIKLFVANGVDFITTNEPELVFEELKK